MPSRTPGAFAAASVNYGGLPKDPSASSPAPAELAAAQDRRAPSPGHSAAGALVLTTRGRRSGRERSVPVQYFPDGDAMVVVAANSGLPRPPAWYLNLSADPRATVDVEGRRLEVVRLVPTEERETPDR